LGCFFYCKSKYIVFSHQQEGIAAPPTGLSLKVSTEPETRPMAMCRIAATNNKIGNPYSFPALLPVAFFLKQI